MKLLLVSSLTLLSLACSRSLYYEYSENGNYSALEIEPRQGRITYRTAPEPHHDAPPSPLPNTTGSNPDTLTVKDYVVVRSYYQQADTVISLNRSFFSSYGKHSGNNRYQVCHSKHVHDQEDADVIKYRKINDSLALVNPEKVSELLSRHSCFVENKIATLPLYFTKTRKIDYRLFKKATELRRYTIRKPEKSKEEFDRWKQQGRIRGKWGVYK